MARKKIVAGNWKMNMTPSQAVKLVEELKPLVVSDDVEVVYCVPAIDIVPVVEAVKGTNVAVGAENMYFEEKGAYTGEISAEMLVDAGVKYVVLGHSERRDYFKEDDVLLNKKVKKAFEKGLTPILCCGETLEQREMGITLDWIRLQIKSDLKDVTAEQVASMVIAYEPIWAIGTGKTATTEQAEEVCKAIRECIAEVYGTDTAEKVRIRYFTLQCDIATICEYLVDKSNDHNIVIITAVQYIGLIKIVIIINCRCFIYSTESDRIILFESFPDSR